ncbi:hypothetical protein HZA87_00660 [Candidatus Uhrbacteria bacterium]|nr:hypothetical protein [Candidatus Uhrbacteria bacterium]
MPHPMEGQIGEHHRIHFYENEGRGSESERGEGKIYDTRLSRLTKQLSDSLEQIPVEKREVFKQLIDAITRSSLSYIDSRIGLINASKSGNKDAIMEADRARRVSHIRLVDSIRIACRNFATNIEGWTIEKDVAEIVGSGDDSRIRDMVAEAAIDFVWQLLDEEDTKSRKK